MQEPSVSPAAGPRDAFDEQPPLSPAERVLDVFVAPTKTFADLRRNRSWWLPFVLIAIFSYVFTGSAMSRVGIPRLAESAIRNNPAQNERMQQATPEGRAQTLSITAAILKVTFYSVPVLTLLICAIAALLLWVGFNFILGGSATYPGMFAVAMFASLPSIVRSLLTTTMLFLGDVDSFNINDPIGTNPGFYMGPDSPTFLKAALGSFDIFSLWMLALMAIGAAIVARVKVRSGLILVFTAWLIFVIVKAGVAAVTS